MNFGHRIYSTNKRKMWVNKVNLLINNCHSFWWTEFYLPSNQPGALCVTHHFKTHDSMAEKQIIFLSI